MTGVQTCALPIWLKNELGIDPTEDIDRIGFDGDVFAASGFFENLKLPPDIGPGTPYGDGARMWTETSPEGEKGVDNNMFRAIGCVANYRGPDGTLFHFTTKYLQQHNYNRVIMELTDVDSLTNDDDVTLTTYRGREQLMTDSTGDGFLPGGTQRIDTRWGKEFIYKTKGRIKDGVLTTDPMPIYTFPATAAFEDTTVQVIKGMRLKLKLTPDKAEGLMAGYTDVEAWYLQLNES